MSNAAKQLIDNTIAVIQRGWTQNENARNMHLHSVAPDDPDACSWCLNGALYVAGVYGHSNDSYAAFKQVQHGFDMALFRMNAGTTSYIRYNDAPGRKKEEVIALLEAAKEFC